MGAKPDSHLNILLESCEAYMLDKKQCTEIIQEVVDAVKDWKTMANQLQIPKLEMDRFSARFDKHIS